MKTRFEEKYKYNGYSTAAIKKPLWIPIIRGILVKNQTIDFNIVDEFLVDTGAAISLLPDRYSSFLSDSRIIGDYKVQYGQGGINCLPLYNVGIRIQGLYYFEFVAALDKNLKLNPLIGNQTFLDTFDNVIMCPIIRKTTFYKKGV